MGVWRQNIGTKGLARKIFQDKELAEFGIAGLPLDAGNALCTFPLWAVYILGQGCSSQERGIFLWKAVEKVKVC
jgi:hypothetical protein